MVLRTMWKAFFNNYQVILNLKHRSDPRALVLRLEFSVRQPKKYKMIKILLATQKS